MSDLHQLVADNPLWYHTLELGPGVVTPGWFDLRGVVGSLPWPDVTGKRCLDVGTYDGFFAFELERRGAAEVVAADIGGHEDWDWFPRVKARGPAYLAQVAGEKGRGFEIAAEALGSSVEKRVVSVYDLSADHLGTFDVVVCGSLLLHLRDPMRALEAIRSVCRPEEGVFLSMEQVEPVGSLLTSVPLLRIRGAQTQWAVPNLAGHRAMLDLSGFDVEQVADPYVVPLGPGHPAPASRLSRRLAQRLRFGGQGVPMSAVLSRRAV